MIVASSVQKGILVSFSQGKDCTTIVTVSITHWSHLLHMGSNELAGLQLVRMIEVPDK